MEVFKISLIFSLFKIFPFTLKFSNTILVSGVFFVPSK